MRHLDGLRAKRSLVRDALVLAATQYDRDAAAALREGVRRHFEQQAAEARALADKISQTDLIELHD